MQGGPSGLLSLRFADAACGCEEQLHLVELLHLNKLRTVQKRVHGIGSFTFPHCGPCKQQDHLCTDFKGSVACAKI